MQVALDEAAGDETAVQVDGPARVLCLARILEPRCYRRDLSRHDANIAGSALIDSRVLQDEVHGHPRCQALA